MLLCTALLLPAGAAVGRSTSALQQIGPAPAQVAALTHYGLAVPSRTGLRSLVPAGWKTFVHQSATLPPTLSWSPGQAWTAVLENMGREHNLSVLVDWDAQTVLIRTPQVAAEESVTRKDIKQAAVTPLPKFNGKNKGKNQKGAAPAGPASAASAAAQPSVMAQVPPGPAAAALNAQHNESHRLQEWQSAHAQQADSLARLPVVRTNPTPSMVASLNKAVQANPPKLASSPDFSYSGPSAWNKASARTLAQGIANKFQLRLVWAAPEEQLKGPVTLLAQSAEQDTALLQKAMGAFSAVELELLAADKVLRAVPRGQAWGIAQAWPMPPAVETAAAPAAVAAPQAAATAAAEPAPAPVPQLQLDLGVGVSLEEALVAFAHKHGYTLEWKVEGGFEAGRALSYTGDTVVQVLAQALPPLGISADVYTRDKHIVIRPGEARDR